MKLIVYIASTMLLSCILSQTLKMVFDIMIRKRKFKLGNITSDGNYPSSHTAFVTSVTTISWIDTIYSIIVEKIIDLQIWCSMTLTVFLIIVIRDALGVRYTVQKLCDALPKISSGTKYEDEMNKFRDIKSGHEVHEVIGGAVLGCFVAAFSSSFYYGIYKYIWSILIMFTIYIFISAAVLKKKKT